MVNWRAAHAADRLAVRARSNLCAYLPDACQLRERTEIRTPMGAASADHVRTARLIRPIPVIYESALPASDLPNYREFQPPLEVGIETVCRSPDARRHGRTIAMSSTHSLGLTNRVGRPGIPLRRVFESSRRALSRFQVSETGDSYPSGGVVRLASGH